MLSVIIQHLYSVSCFQTVSRYRVVDNYGVPDLRNNSDSQKSNSIIASTTSFVKRISTVFFISKIFKSINQELSRIQKWFFLCNLNLLRYRKIWNMKNSNLKIRHNIANDMLPIVQGGHITRTNHILPCLFQSLVLMVMC